MQRWLRSGMISSPGAAMGEEVEMRCSLWMFGLLLMASVASANEFGGIEGRFLLEKAAAGSAEPSPLDPSVVVHPETGGIAELFVYLRNAPAKIDPAVEAKRPKEVVIETRGAKFHPQAIVVRTDQEIRWTNADRAGFL